MATPVIETTSTYANSLGVSSYSVTVPTGTAAGDLLVFFLVMDAPAGATTTWPAGYTKLYETEDDNNNVLGCCAYKYLTAAESSTISVTASGVRKIAVRGYRISGAEDSSTQAPEYQLVTNGGAVTDHDPPSITPTGGSKDYLYIAALHSNTTAAVNTYPSGYINTGQTLSGPSGAQAGIATGDKSTTGSSTENPSAFVLAAARDAIPVTFAVHPEAGAPAGVTGSINVTLEDASSTASAAVTNRGSISETLENATSTASGTITVTGSISETLADAVSAASGSIVISGSISELLADATSSATGVLTVSGSIAETLENATSATSGVVGNVVSGTINAVLEDASSAAAGVVPYTGTINTTLEDASMTASGSVVLNVTGTLNETLAPATMAASGAVTVNVTGTIAAILEDASMSGSGNVVIDYETPKHNMILTVENRIMTLTIEDREMIVQ